MIWRIREAKEGDYDSIAVVHMDSIRELGPLCYSPEVVADWGRHRDGSRYRNAAERGEEFFVAESEDGTILGFSASGVSDTGRLAVYVRGSDARQGIGAALLEAAEDNLRSKGAEQVCIDASLNAVSFYLSHGYVALGRDVHTLSSGGNMACEKMAKRL